MVENKNKITRRGGPVRFINFVGFTGFGNGKALGGKTLIFSADSAHGADQGGHYSKPQNYHEPAVAGAPDRDLDGGGPFGMVRVLHGSLHYWITPFPTEF